MVERRIAEDGSMLAEGLSGAIAPESFGTGRVCIEPSCESAPVPLQQHRLVRAPREPGRHRPPLRHVDPPPWASAQLPPPQPEVGRLSHRTPVGPPVPGGASVHCVADTRPVGPVATRTEAPHDGPTRRHRGPGHRGVQRHRRGHGRRPGRRGCPGGRRRPPRATASKPWPSASDATGYSCSPDRRDRRGRSAGHGAADRRRLRPPRHPRQQRRRDAARSHRRCPGRGVATHGRAQPARPPLHAPTPRCPTCWPPPSPAPATWPTS